MSKTITIFGSSEPTEGDEEYQIAYNVGYELAKAGYSICNGGYEGTMEASAKGAKDAGGKTCGVTTLQYSLRTKNQYIDEEIKTQTALERLETLIEKGDGYVVLKGSTGTLAELSTTWEWINKGVISFRPIILYGEFWLPTINTLKSNEPKKIDHRAKSQKKVIIDCINVANTSKEVVEILRNHFSERQKP